MSETHMYRVIAREGTRVCLEVRAVHPDVPSLPASKAEFLYQLLRSTDDANDSREEPPDDAYETFQRASDTARAKLEEVCGRSVSDIPPIDSAAALEEWNTIAGRVIERVSLIVEPADSGVALKSALGITLGHAERAFGKVELVVTDPDTVAHLVPGMYWDNANVVIDDSEG